MSSASPLLSIPNGKIDEATALHLARGLDPASLSDLVYAWPMWRRPSQAPPTGDWDIWVILSGRFWGKTRVGSEMVRSWANRDRQVRIHLVARTAADARDTMVEGESGILAVCAGDRANRPLYEPSKRRITWPGGAQAILFSAEEPDALRGPQCGRWWADEVASWLYVQETWDMLQFGARLGDHVQGIVTTTPRPISIIKELVKCAREQGGRVRITRGGSLENRVNVAENAVKALVDRYGGTRLGRQELDGEILDDNPNALFRRADLDAARVTQVPDLASIRVGVDPAVTSGEDADATGIVVCGRDRSDPPHFYVIDDMTLAMASPLEWAGQAVAAYNKHSANMIVAERNQGGEMVEATIRQIDRDVPITMVHASRGKATRAEPVSALCEQGRLHFVGSLPTLEDECCEWDPAGAGDSPDRMDAMVWSVTSMLGSDFGFAGVGELGRGGRLWGGNGG